jgi:Nucleotidyl transferase AbiEii toxin, Type IV TA system
MAAIYLHNHPEFASLIRILEEETGILAGLIEKDYWIMHTLYGLKKQSYDFQLKGGTSLSKGFEIIDRFSEDIDMHINTPKELAINENPNNSNPKNIQKKKDYYDQLARDIKIDGITKVVRDVAFDDLEKYNSGGIRLLYTTQTDIVSELKEGILIEAGFATVTPNTPVTISSWAYDRAIITSGISIIDNRAIDIPCYDFRYTFVEKLQTIATKFRNEQKTGESATNYMRQYYDIYCLLGRKEIQEFIKTDKYLEYKEKHFPAADFAIPIKENQAFILSDPEIREKMKKRYESRKSLYYKGQPSFDDVLARIHHYIDQL